MSRLYDVTITFDPKDFKENPEVEAVGISGEFLFYKSGLTGHTDETGMIDCEEKIPPAKYVDGLDSIGGLYYEAMTKNVDNIYEVTLKLPAGVYPYHFIINPELCDASELDERMVWAAMIDADCHKVALTHMIEVLRDGSYENHNYMITDPKNPPVAPTVTGKQTNSELFVGTAEECTRIPSVTKSEADMKNKGIISYQSYTDVNGDTQTAGVYLPPNYDRNKTYPLIVVSHGGGGNEADWFSQGNLNIVMDNMIAQGRTKEAIVVTPNNAVYEWNFAVIAKNIEEHLIPYLETVYPISKDVKDRAFCGLSMGSMTTLYMYYHRSCKYEYFGAFSGGIAPGHKAFDISDPHIREVKLMIGCAEEDIAYNQREIGIPTTIKALKEAGIEYMPYFVTGSHDWFCWPAMFEYFAEHILWK